jgi:cytidylate kinase
MRSGNIMAFNIAVDGPAGAGKSTIAKRVAKELGIIYVDTGAMYRAMGLYVKRKGLDGLDEAAVSACVDEIDISLSFQDGEQCVLLNGENVNGLIRTPEISAMASHISAYAAVRRKLVSEQQKIAAGTDLIMDGRDIGSCVLPDAALKIYLTASSAVRGKRRHDEMVEKGEACDLETIIKEIEERDYRDMHREISPLVQVSDAVLVDSSDMTIDQVVDTILTLAAERR